MISGRTRPRRVCGRGRSLSRHRGVAEIVAELMILAMTVSLVGSLLAIVGAVVPTHIDRPLGTALVLGAATNDSGVYRIPVAYVATGVVVADLTFQLRTASGNGWNVEPWHIDIQDLGGKFVAHYYPGVGWTSMVDSRYILDSRSTISLVTGTSSGLPDGMVLVVAGNAPWSGTVGMTVC